MQEYKINNALVRIHGKYNEENLKSASKRFMKKVIKQKKEKEKCSNTTI